MKPIWSVKPSSAVCVLLTGLVLSPPLLAQSSEAPVQPTDEVPTYRSEGRRDPFLSLVNAAAEPQRGRGAAGVEGLLVAEIAVRGVLQSQDAVVAIIQGPDKRTYLVRAGDRLADGVVKAVIPEGLVILPDATSSWSETERHDVRRLFPSSEDPKP